MIERLKQPFTPKEDRMTITDADLDYLRNINTSPGPNAGRSIDPTKPGPDADRASPEPRDMPSDENIEKAAQILGVDASAVRAALAQSDAGPKQDVRDKLLRALERRRFVDEGGRYLLTQSQAFDAFTEVMDRRWAGVHGELIPDCPTDGVAARQGNGG
jgi:hypothetical protein